MLADRFLLKLIFVLRLQQINQLMKSSLAQSNPLQQYFPTQSQKSHHSPSPLPKNNNLSKKDILCKIAFEIDGDEEQLLIYSKDTLQTVTDQLVMKLNFASLGRHKSQLQVSEEERQAIEEQIKKKIEIIIESCIDRSPKTQRWKTKLKQFIDHQEREPVEILIKNTLENKQYLHSNIKYFSYNHTIQEQQRGTNSSEQKNAEIIQRAKTIENSLGKSEPKYPNNLEYTQRLYDLGKKNDAIKEYLSKIREERLQQEELSECTFHPKLRKFPLRTESSHYSKTTSHYRDCVFDRLYKQALEKKEKMKLIEQQLSQRVHQEHENLSFIPSINNCSRQIVSMKKQISKYNVESIYDQLYNQSCKQNTKRQGNQCTFKPTLCPNSYKILKKTQKSPHKNQQNEPPTHFQKLCQSEARTQRKHINENSGKDKSPSFLKNFQYLYNDNKSPLSQKRNILKERKKQQQSSFKTLKNVKHNISVKRRVQTCQNDHNYQKSDQRIFKNVIDPSFFGGQTREEGICCKNTKENLFFLTGKTQTDSIRTETNESIIQRVSRNCQQHKQKDSKKMKGKKQHLNPFTFFQLQDQKNNISNRQPLKTISNGQVLKEGVSNTGEIQENQAFECIFTFLSKNREDEITSDFLENNPEIPYNLLNIFYPMAQQMQQLNVGLDREEFVWSLTRIYSTLNEQQQRDILCWSSTLLERV